jgi:carbamoyl-phosphate synthase large subunit
MTASLPALTVLATSVGNDGFAAVRPALVDNGEREVRIVGVDVNPSAAGLLLSDAGVVVPPRSRADELLDRLVTLCRERSVDVLLPLSTEDQEFYAEHRGRFADLGVRLATSALPSLRTANDKLALLEACQPGGVPCPRFRAVGTFAELRAAAEWVGFPHRPFVVKLNRGTGAQGIKVVDPHRSRLDRLFDRDNLRIRFEDLDDGLAGLESLPPMHVAEYLPGREFSVDVLCWEGETLSAVVRDRLATLYGLATHAIVIDHPPAEKAARRVVELLGLSYVVNVQFRCDDEGVPRLMEVNPRIPGTIGLSVAAGVNMPYLAVKLAIGEAVAPPAPAIGTELIRYWNALVRRGPQDR